MAGAAEPGRLAEAIQADLDGLLERWMQAISGKSWTLRMEAKKCHAGDRTGSSLLEQLHQRCRSFLISLGNALHTARGLEMGSPEFREAIQSLSFSVGWMAGMGIPITEAVMLVYTLQDTLGWEARSFFEGLMVVVTEAYSSSQAQKAQAWHRDAMEKSQFVCNLHWRLPMLVLAGDPDRRALDDAVGRVMMLAVMREARAVVVDMSALMLPEETGRQAIEILYEHSKATSVEVHLCGASPILKQMIQKIEPSTRMYYYDELPRALGGAATVNGLSWPKD